MVSWKRVRIVALIGVALWAVSLAILVAWLGEVLFMNAVGHCSFGFLGPEDSPPGQPEQPSEPFCNAAATLLVLQALLVFFVFVPLSPAFSLVLPLILLFLVLDVVWPWLQARRRSGGIARSS